MSFLKRLGTRIASILKPAHSNNNDDAQNRPPSFDEADTTPGNFGMADLVTQRAAPSQPPPLQDNSATAPAVPQEATQPARNIPAQSFVHYIGLFDNMTVVINDRAVPDHMITHGTQEDDHLQGTFKVTTPDGTAHVFWNNPSDIKREFICKASNAVCLDLGDMRDKTFSIDICTMDAVSLGLAFPVIDFSAATPLPDQVRDELPYAHGRRGSYNPRKAPTATKSNKPVIL